MISRTEGTTENSRTKRMKYLALLDCSIPRVRIIKLDSEDEALLENSREGLDFICQVEEKYGFSESQCSWMLMDELNFSIE